MLLGIILVVALVSFISLIVRQSDKSYNALREADDKWLQKQPRCQVTILLDSTLVRSPNFSATLHDVGISRYRFRITAKQQANDWLKDSFKNGYMEVNGILYPTSQITKMFFNEV